MDNEDLGSKIRNKIKWGMTSNPSKDDSDYSSIQIKCLRVKTKNNVKTIYPYGTHGNPPVGSLVLLISTGDRDGNVCIPLSGPLREKGLKEGEFVSGNFITESTIKYAENGDIIIKSSKDIIADAKNITATATNVTINADTTNNGNVTINGDLIVSGDVTSNSVSSGSVTGGTVSTTGGIDLDTHTHLKEATPPIPGQTGPPV